MKTILLALSLALSTSAMAMKNGLPIREIKRTYTNLKNLDLSECLESYRFVNRNWMDCQLTLPETHQVTPANYPNLNYTIDVDLGDVTAYIDIRRNARTFEEASTKTRLWVYAYYKKAGETTIHELPKKYYSKAILASLLKSAFTRSDADGSMIATFLGVPNRRSELAVDSAGEEIFVGARDVTPDFEACKKTFDIFENDNWPNPDTKSSFCVVKEGEARDILPIGPAYWSDRLVVHKFSKIITMDNNVSVLFQFLPGQYIIFMGEGDNFEVEKTFQESREAIKGAIQKLGTHQTLFKIKKSELKTLKNNERILGRMVLKNNKIDFEMISKL